MCNCIKTLEERVHEQFPEYNKKTVERVTAVGTHIFPSFQFRTNTEFNLSLAGQIKKIPIPVMHVYCPFCGEKYPEAETEKETEDGKGK